MESIVTVPVTLSVHQKESTQGQIRTQSFNHEERLKRALKLGGISWAVAIGCIFLPVVHFFLVPLALIMGPILFLLEIRKKDLLLDGTGECPKCQQAVAITSQPLNWPLQFICSKCQTLIVVERQPS